MGLNAKQKEAVEYLDGPLLVLAGPGTGKTQLLSEKVAYILKNTDTAPENILCLTFTETGASNMRERLKSIVGKDGAKVNIGTYHAFGSEILAMYKNYSEDYDRRLDAAIDEVTQFRIVKEIRDNLPARDILHGDNVKDIISVISSAKSAGLSADDLATIAKQNVEDSTVLSNAISPLLKNVVPRAFKASYENAYLPIYNILKDYLDLPPIMKNVEKNIVYLARDLKAAITDAEASEKITPLSSWRDAYFEKDSSGDYRLKDRVANKKLASLAIVMEKYDSKLRDDGLYDFDDMIEEASKILRTDNGFKLTLSERYQFIMLDEFQDTNPSQLSIIKELTDYEKPMIMAVGDDDQAIYEFQGAKSTNLTDFQEHYNAHVVALVENYRSTQEILDFSRKVIEQAPDRFADKELISHRPAFNESHIYRTEFLTSEMEFNYVASEIAKLIKSGVPQSEIAVISYKRKYFTPLLPFLNAYPEIKISYEKQNNLLEDEKIHQITTIARFVYENAAEKRVDTSILEILSYPFFDLPILEVVKLVAQAKREKKAVFETLATSDNENVRAVTEFLANLIVKSFSEPLEIMLDYIIGTAELCGYTSPFLSYYAKKTDFVAFSLYENLAALRGKLRKHFGEKSLRLADLINMIDEYNDAEMELNAVSPYREADEAVSILTAHKAKGLEFSYVFIISADHVAWGKGKGNNNLLALPKNLLHIRHTGTTDGEKLRILYVALTRAKEGLFITNSLHDFDGKSPERLEYFDEYQDDDTIKSPLIPSGVVKTEYDMDVLDVAERNIKNWLSFYAATSPDLRAIYLERMKNFRMSSTALTSFVDIIYGGPESFFKNYVLDAPRDPITEAIAFGDLVHETFEQVTNKGISDEEAADFFLAKLDEEDFSSDIKAVLREKGPTDLAVSLKAFGELLRNGKAEVNLTPEKLVFEGVPIGGQIDHIIIDEDAKTIEIYDFKTAQYQKDDWHKSTKLYKYMLQLLFYKLLLSLSPTYHKYTINKAHILFVTPDEKDGEVHDKVYEYNKEDETLFKNLLVSVYNMVTSLSFLDDPEIFIPADRSRKIKELLAFIELLLAKNIEK